MLSALFRSSPRGEVEERGWEWFAQEPPTWSGMTVTRETSMQLLTVYGCVRFISDALSTLRSRIP